MVGPSPESCRHSYLCRGSLGLIYFLFFSRGICLHQFGLQQRAAGGTVKFLEQIATHQLAHERTGVRGWKRPSSTILFPVISEFAKRTRALRAANPLSARIGNDGQFLAKWVAHSGFLSSASLR